MRSVIFIFAVALFAGFMPSIAQAQSCELLNNCPPRPAGHGKPAPMQPRRMHRPRPPVLTVAAVEAEFTADAPVYIFGDEDTSSETLETITPKLAAFMKTRNFKRNPTIATDENGLFPWTIDVVASYEQNKAVNGYYQFSVAWDGAIWPFASKDDALKFVADPQKYTPAYGGHCAYCLAVDDVVLGTVVAVYKDRLYLFASDEVQKDWAERSRPLHRECKSPLAVPAGFQVQDRGDCRNDQAAAGRVEEVIAPSACGRMFGHAGRWRSHRESNPGFSLERAAS